MKNMYTVSKDNATGLWYAHRIGFSNIPVFSERGTFHKSKKGALMVCADRYGLNYRDYMLFRKNS